MTEFLNAISPFLYAFLIIGSVIFGISLAVNIWLYKTIGKIRKECDNNYVNNVTQNENIYIEFHINSAKKEYAKYLDQTKKANKIKRKNKIKKAFNLNGKKVEVEGSLKDIFIKLISEVSKPFSNYGGEDRTYLSFSKNEAFSILKTLSDRLDIIFSKSGVKWLKNVRISYVATGVELYVNYKNFIEKTWALIIFNLINFFMWFFRVFSPVSIGKYFIKNYYSDSLSVLICDTVIELVGKELAVIYKTSRTGNEKHQILSKDAV